jgi:hypothetical protein
LASRSRSPDRLACLGRPTSATPSIKPVKNASRAVYDVARTATLPGVFLVLVVGLFVFGIVQVYEQRNLTGIQV